jgi:16S rRNA processing protein RimM
VILKLAGIDDPAAARALVGQDLLAPQDAAPSLPDGEYFHYQLIDMQVFTEVGEDLGRIAEIILTGSNDVYVVSGPNGEVLLPAISQVILQVDPEQGVMTVRLMEGLR